MNGFNVLRDKQIIQLLGKSCSISDKETLKKLRQLSTSYYNTLKKPYWDLLKIQINFERLYSKVKLSFPNGFERKLKLKNWDPIIAQRIRVLNIDMTLFPVWFYIDISPCSSSSQNSMNTYRVLFNQLYPYITTLKVLDLPIPEKLDPIQLLNFIRQFINLKNISLGIKHKEEDYLNKVKGILLQLKSLGLIVELRLCRMDQESLEGILAPEKGLKNLVHRFGFDSVNIRNEDGLQRFANFVTENESIISDIDVTGIWNIDRERFIFQHLRVISSFVSSLYIGKLNIFDSSVPWPILISLKLNGTENQLPDLSISFPKLQSLVIEDTDEDEAFFSNTEITQKQALEIIFHGCAQSLKKLSIIPNQYVGPKGNKYIVPNSDSLHRNSSSVQYPKDHLEQLVVISQTTFNQIGFVLPYSKIIN